MTIFPGRITSPGCVGNALGPSLSWGDIGRYCPLPWRESFFRLLYCHMQITVQLCGRNVLRNYGQRLRESWTTVWDWSYPSCPEPPCSGDMRHTLHWMPLERRRTMFRLILMHRCINQLATAYLNKSVQRNCTLGYAGTRGFDNPHLFPIC